MQSQGSAPEGSEIPAGSDDRSGRPVGQEQSEERGETQSCDEKTGRAEPRGIERTATEEGEIDGCQNE